MKVRLTSACYAVSTAASGTEALRRAGIVRPRIVVIGASLPDMTTADLCHGLRALPGGGDLQILAQAQGEARIAALQAGASALIDHMDDDLTLLARIRGLMRTDPQNDAAALPSGLAEPATAFQHDSRPRAVFISGQADIALGWRHALQGQVDFSISVCDPERALADAARGRVPELYLIAADMNQPGDGLRLMSELRSRPGSRDAGFVIALHPERAELAEMALDLGAGDVLAADMVNPVAAAEAAIRLETQLDRKREADQRRLAAQRQMQLASLDPLTGLHNRRHALPRLARLHDQALSEGDPLAVIVMDLDRFKAVNDNHGHAAGDAVLISVAQRLALALPPEALLARMGGEEFLAVLPRHGADAALAVAEEIRLQVQESPVTLPPECAADEIHVSLSAGVAVLGGELAAGPEKLLARADRALLLAKAMGRNRIVMAEARLRPELVT